VVADALGFPVAQASLRQDARSVGTNEIYALDWEAP
jgi:hypothetical protein